MRYEIKLALRLAARRPWMTGALVCLVGGATAINTALYSALHVLVLRGIPGGHTQDLVVVGSPDADRVGPVTQQTLDHLQEHPAFTEVSGLELDVPLSAGATPSDGLFAATATTNLMALLGVHPAHGRWFNEDDENTPVRPIVIGWDVWTSRFGRDPTVVGRPVELGSDRFVVVGVMPAGFDFPLGTNVWLKLPRRSGMAAGSFRSTVALARLRAAGAPRQVVVDTRLLPVVPASEFFDPKGLPSLVLLLIGSLLMLAVSLTQVVGLGLAQAVGRRPAAAVRLVLGGERSHLVRHCLADALVPAVGGLVLALVCVPWLQIGASLWIPPEVLRGRTLGLVPPVVAFAVVLSLTVWVLLAVTHFATIPWHRAESVLRNASGPSVHRRGRVRFGLLVVQTAVAVALLYLSVLTLQSFARLLGTDLGFVPDGLVVVQLPWGQRSLSERRAEQDRVRMTVDSAAALPGVASAAATISRPFGGPRMNVAVRLPDGTDRRASLEIVSAGYFKVMGIPMLAGRDFDVSDSPAAPLRAILNHSLSLALGEGRPLVGERVSVGGLSYEVIGTVADVRTFRPEQPASPQVYVSAVQRNAPPDALVIRTRAGWQDRVTPSVSAVVTRVWSRPPVHAESLSDRIAHLLAPFRARGLFLSALAVAAFLLTTVGLTGSLVDGVRARRAELAVRMALGATTDRLRRAVLSEAVTVTAVGVLIGLAAAAGITRLVGALLHDVSPLQGGVALAVAAPFLLSAALAGRHAANVACRFEPAESLKTV